MSLKRLAFNPWTLYLSQSPVLPGFGQTLLVPEPPALETRMNVPG